MSPQPEPIRVVVTGAAGQIAYSLLYSIAKGDVFGKDQVRQSLTSWLHNPQQQSPIAPEADHCPDSWAMHCVQHDRYIMDSSWIIHVWMWAMPSACWSPDQGNSPSQITSSRRENTIISSEMFCILGQHVMFYFCFWPIGSIMIRIRLS